MEEFTPEQRLLMKIRADYCGGVSAELARRIDKDVTYVNRLFYPVGKKGRKGIGLEVMRACNKAFGLPPGYWQGSDSKKLPEALTFLDLRPDEVRLVGLFRELKPEQRLKLETIANEMHAATHQEASQANPFPRAHPPASPQVSRAMQNLKPKKAKPNGGHQDQRIPDKRNRGGAA